MRPHPLLARLALRTGAAFRCAERLESREGLAARFAPDLEAGPLVAEDRLSRLVEPPDGSAALQRTLNRTVAPAVAREAGEGAVAEWLPLGRVSAGTAPVSGLALPARPAPWPTRPVDKDPAVSRSQTAPIVPASPEAVQAILDRVASSFPQAGEQKAARAAGSRSRVEAEAARRRLAPQGGVRAGDHLPLGRAGGGSFLLRQAAQTPVLIDETETPPSSLFAQASRSSSMPAAFPAPTPRSSPMGERGRATPSLPPARSGLPVEAAARTRSPEPVAQEFSRGSRTLPALSAPSTVGGFRGLAGLGDRAEVGRPEIAPGPGAPSPLYPSTRFDPPIRSSESGAGAGPLALPHPLAARPGLPSAEDGAPWRSDLGASLGPLGADFESALDHVLRRAARRHGIEVLEP